MVAFDLTLTFDNGPDAETTPAVLDLLRARAIATTFFLVGRKLSDPHCRDLAIRAREEGHWLGNHTFTHTVPLGENPSLDVVETEVANTEIAITELGEVRKLFRPFGGGGNLDQRLLKRTVADYLVQRKYSCVLWNAIPRDWADPDGWVELALEQCRQQPWTLMVLHDLPTGAMKHLDRFLNLADAMGARFRQDFPPECVPIRDGIVALPLQPYLSELN